MEVIWRAPETADQLKQKEILESFITQGVDGIAISCSNADFLTEHDQPRDRRGHSRRDLGLRRAEVEAHRVLRCRRLGRRAGSWASRRRSCSGGKGKVALITSLGADNLQRRLEGVKEVLAKHPGMKIVETYDIKEDPTRCAEIIATGMRRYPDLGAWISVGGWPVFTRNALDAVDPAKTKFISLRHHPARARPAADGQGPGADRPEVLRLGQRAGEAAREHQGRASRPPRPSSTPGVDVVTRENVDAVRGEWKKLEAGQ